MTTTHTVFNEMLAFSTELNEDPNLENELNIVNLNINDEEDKTSIKKDENSIHHVVKRFKQNFIYQRDPKDIYLLSKNIFNYVDTIIRIGANHIEIIHKSFTDTYVSKFQSVIENILYENYYHIIFPNSGLLCIVSKEEILNHPSLKLIIEKEQKLVSKVKKWYLNKNNISVVKMEYYTFIFSNMKLNKVEMNKDIRYKLSPLQETYNKKKFKKSDVFTLWRLIHL